jgi:protease I
MKKALILTWEGYKDYEAVYPYYRLLEEGFEVDVMSNTLGKVLGVLGGSIPCNRSITELTMENTTDFLQNYDLLIIPGGVNSLEKLRLHLGAVKLVGEWCSKGKVIGSICSGAQMLITAKVLKDRKISAYYSMEQDVWNAGAAFVDAPAVVDQNIITSPHYKWVGHWMKSVLETYYKFNKK